jgi:hypothetical protein
MNDELIPFKLYPRRALFYYDWMRAATKRLVHIELEPYRRRRNVRHVVLLKFLRTRKP